MSRPSKWCLLVRASICCAVAVTLSAAPAVADGPAPKRAQRQFEIRFMEDMIDHHAMAVMMAEMCLDKNLPHQKLRELCESIAATQMEEIEEMQAWLEDWYDREHEPQMTRKMERQMQRLDELDGEEFEIEFMEMMIPHHEEAIRNARQCTHRAYHEDLKKLCHDIIESQREEIERMEHWLCKWYDICHHDQH